MRTTEEEPEPVSIELEPIEPDEKSSTTRNGCRESSKGKESTYHEQN
jgi:hypothetical protein